MQENDKTIVIEADVNKRYSSQDNISQYMINNSAETGNTIDKTPGPGCIIGRKYRILSTLQDGGSSSVFIVHPLDDLSQRYVAKVMTKTVRDSSSKRFLREARLHSNINHPNIVKMIDYWSDDYGQYTVLEFIDGKSLKACCGEFSFDEGAALIVAYEVAKALRYVWNKFQIVHRDIKPENIMVDNANYIKLLDFGISKSKNVSQETYLTMDNTILGTPGYMSPEQFINSKSVSIQSDMFSLGATIFYVMTGKVPFEGNDLAQLYKNTCENAPPPILEYCPELSDRFVALMNKLMQKNPADRPASWDDVILEIHSML